jgi:hypothetical protein
MDTRAWSVDSNWLHVAWYSWVLFKMIDNSYFKNAKKITISTHANLWSYIFAQFIWIWYFSGTIYSSYLWNNIDLRQSFRRVEFNWSSVNQTSWSITTWEHDISMVFDFVNKTAKLSLSWYVDISWTITDAAITSVKNNLNCLNLWFYNNSSYPTDTSSYYNNYYLKIEY